MSQSQIIEQWISIAQRSARRYLHPAAFALGVLEAGSLAVAQRSVLCQLQAYAILIVSCVAFASYAYHNSVRRECAVETFTSPYCVDCKGESRGVLIVGRRTNEVSSGYEQLYANPLRVHFAIFVWLAWIAYGSVFHEAQHTASEDAYVSELVHNLTSGPWLDSLLPHVRTLRIVTLFVVACYDSSKRAAPHVVYTTALFFVLLFFPSAQSTAQALHTVELLSRTAVFVTLFVLAEIVERAEHYRDWLGGYDEAYRIHLTGLLMAIGRARPLRPKSEEIFIPVCGPDAVGRSFSIERHLASWRIVVRSAWILVASDAAIGLAVVESLYLLYRLVVARQPLDSIVKAKPDYLRTKPTEPVRTSSRGSKRSGSGSGGGGGLLPLPTSTRDVIVLQSHQPSAQTLSFPVVTAAAAAASPPSSTSVSRRSRSQARAAAAAAAATASLASDPEEMRRPATPTPSPPSPPQQLPESVAATLALLSKNSHAITQDASARAYDSDTTSTKLSAHTPVLSSPLVAAAATTARTFRRP